MLDDPTLFFFLVPAVLVAGISKGGFGGGLGIVAVPLISLKVTPLQAAALMLPILCLMDLVGMWRYRKDWHRPTMKVLIPGALVGILFATLTARYVDEQAVRIIIGTIAVLFALDHWLGKRGQKQPAEANATKGIFWSAVAGFTSFVAHAGGPPVSIYLLPLRLHQTSLVATTVMFFTVVNYVKLVPYTWLGQFDRDVLTVAALMAPLAVVSMLMGIWLHSRVSGLWFYRICYVFVFVVGLKLLWDGFGLSRLV
jgi:uncharacterized membrane protein YfcA